MLDAIRASFVAASALSLATTSANAAGIDLGTFSYSSGPVDLGPSVAQDASGLTYNNLTGTLFVTRNNGPERLFELDTSGNLLRSIGLTGFDDTEGIAHLGGTTFAVTEEARDQIVVFEITAGPAVNIDHSASAVYTFSPGSGIDTANDNNGLEGLSFDSSTGLFAMVQERSPRGVFEFALPGSGTVISATSPFDLDTPTFGITDAAGIAQLPGGNLLILSDESARIIEVDPLTGTVIGSFDLASNHPGGSAPASFQPEGIAYNPNNGEIYVLSEPDSFYVLTPADFTPIPEPVRTVALALGLAAVALVRRRSTAPLSR